MSEDEILGGVQKILEVYLTVGDKQTTRENRCHAVTVMMVLYALYY
jgi:hypothetical protein